MADIATSIAEHGDMIGKMEDALSQLLRENSLLEKEISALESAMKGSLIGMQRGIEASNSILKGIVQSELPASSSLYQQVRARVDSGLTGGVVYNEAMAAVQNIVPTAKANLTKTVFSFLGNKTLGQWWSANGPAIQALEDSVFIRDGPLAGKSCSVALTELANNQGAWPGICKSFIENFKMQLSFMPGETSLKDMFTGIVTGQGDFGQKYYRVLFNRIGAGSINDSFKTFSQNLESRFQDMISSAAQMEWNMEQWQTKTDGTTTDFMDHMTNEMGLMADSFRGFVRPDAQFGTSRSHGMWPFAGGGDNVLKVPATTPNPPGAQTNDIVNLLG